jgi:hypothetical protein
MSSIPLGYIFSIFFEEAREYIYKNEKKPQNLRHKVCPSGDG